MSRLKSRWFVFSAVLGIAAFMTTFYVAYAEFVQWSREQPSIAFGGSAAVILPGDSIRVFEDEALTDELEEDETLVIEIPQLQPPLDVGESEVVFNKFLWLRNESAQRMFPIRVCCIDIVDENGEEVGGWYRTFNVDRDSIDTGEVANIRIEFHVDNNILGNEFNLIIGATGETEDGEQP